MKKSNLIHYSCQIVIILIIIAMSGCKKNLKVSFLDLSGIWVSTDYIDTLDFKSEKDLYKNRDHYIYSISGDKITLEYNGEAQQLIYTGLSTHEFKLSGSKLTIDFRPPYYGLRPQIVNFIRK
jgi:hypothetical protein